MHIHTPNPTQTLTQTERQEAASKSTSLPRTQYIHRRTNTDETHAYRETRRHRRRRRSPFSFRITDAFGYVWCWMAKTLRVAFTIIQQMCVVLRTYIFFGHTHIHIRYTHGMTYIISPRNNIRILYNISQSTGCCAFACLLASKTVYIWKYLCINIFKTQFTYNIFGWFSWLWPKCNILSRNVPSNFAPTTWLHHNIANHTLAVMHFHSIAIFNSCIVIKGDPNGFHLFPI